MTSYADLQHSGAFETENLAYIESLYEDYRQDPNSVPESWRAYFETHAQEFAAPNYNDVREKFLTLARSKTAPATSAASHTDSYLENQLKVYRLISGYRRYGHLCAKTDPLGLAVAPVIPNMELSTYGLSLEDPNEYDAKGLGGLKTATIKKIVALCQQTYCGDIGFEFEYLDDPKEVAWLRQRIEQFSQWKLTKEQKISLLKELSAVEGLEKTFGSRYVGVTRFSLEGGDTQIPFLNYVIKNSTAHGAREVVLAMAHRGRLNVLVNVLGMPANDVFAQFEGKYAYDEGHSDDVKYHYGYSSDLGTPNGPIHASLSFNPSHLEIISPVAQGSVRARQDRRKDVERKEVFAIQIHGDSAFIGQGIVMETFGLSQTRGFKVGGSVHLVINNQVGFTTSKPEDTRSSQYCTDTAKIVNVPVFHVNGDKPEAVLFIAALALEYHSQFKKDVVIDLVCYRRYGHNEGDEPSATQPLMYQVIRKLPSVRKLYADKLIAEGVMDQQQSDAIIDDYRDALEKNQSLVEHVSDPDYALFAPDWKLYEGTHWNDPVKTALSKKTFEVIAQALTAVPENFKLQAQVAKIIAARKEAFNADPKTDSLIWGDAEALAYASLVHEHYAVRLVGQDSGRGTFAHRHAVLHEQTTAETFTSLEHISADQANFTVVDSLLSENAVMAFEYGYTATEPRALVLWEAQYGDFSNGAQVVIDQFLSAGEQKWKRYSGLVLLLPHGYEGAGPEHSSARLERYLQLCAQDNMQVCVPSTPAQMFHMLRRQMLRPYRKPLIVLTPKSLLRKAKSSISEILQGQFQCVISDESVKADPMKRVILCSGKVYYDLLEKREALGNKDTALLRLEQLYPFPHDDLVKALATFSKAKTFVWCQEEPENQGAWRQIRDELAACLDGKKVWQYVGRSAAASTAAGYKKLHEKEQQALLNSAFGVE